MQPDPDSIRLRHMLDATREALGYARRRSRADLETDTMLFRALVKCIEIVGEAATQVTPEGRALAPLIPWRELRGMRNRLIHAYFDIDLDIVWQTVSTDLPELERLLSAVVEP